MLFLLYFIDFYQNTVINNSIYHRKYLTVGTAINNFNELAFSFVVALYS